VVIVDPSPQDPASLTALDADEVGRARAVIGLSLGCAVVWTLLNGAMAPITHHGRPLGVAGAGVVMIVCWTLALRLLGRGHIERGVVLYSASGLILLLVMGTFVPELALLFTVVTFLFTATGLSYLGGRDSRNVIILTIVVALGLLLVSLGLEWTSGIPANDFRFVNLAGMFLVLSVDATLFTRLRRTLEARARRAVEAERDAAALQLRVEQQQRLESLGQLAGGVAHDFNNFLTVILGFSALAAEDLRDHPEALENLARVQSAAERAAALTRQLLIFGRRDRPQVEVVDLNTVIEGTDSILKAAVGEVVDLRIRLAEGLGPVRVDVSQIEQVLLNLTVNARDAMPGGGTVLIETSERSFEAEDDSELAGSFVCLSVTDTGTGFSAEAREHGFEPFFTTKPAGRGTGLGLSTVYGIAKAAGGDVRLYSEAGIGSSIRVYLPLAGADGEARLPSAGELPRGSGQGVLVVEDEEQVRSLASGILARHGYRVVAVTEAREALANLEADPALSLLLTDVVMPGLSGPRLVEEARVVRPDLRVVYMSGYPRDLWEGGEIDPGLVIMEKPFDARVLLEHVSRALA
jgi:signal transduction histidine kinase/CheY-like chemotaxis protein